MNLGFLWSLLCVIISQPLFPILHTKPFTFVVEDHRVDQPWFPLLKSMLSTPRHIPILHNVWKWYPRLAFWGWMWGWPVCNSLNLPCPFWDRADTCFLPVLRISSLSTLSLPWPFKDDCEWPHKGHRPATPAHMGTSHQGSWMSVDKAYLKVC